MKTPKRNSQDAQVEEARAEARAEELKLQSLLEEAEARAEARAEELKLQSLLRCPSVQVGAKEADAEARAKELKLQSLLELKS